MESELREAQSISKVMLLDITLLQAAATVFYGEALHYGHVLQALALRQKRTDIAAIYISAAETANCVSIASRPDAHKHDNVGRCQ